MIPLRTRAAKVLAHPLRAALLDRIIECEEASPSYLAEGIAPSLGVVAYHVRTLERLGMVEPAGTAQRRGATEHYYRATEEGRRVAAALDELREVPA